jgi:hypothetical protein
MSAWSGKSSSITINLSRDEKSPGHSSVGEEKRISGEPLPSAGVEKTLDP